MKSGWDGSTPVLVVCPINPFEWPVKASVAKFAARTLDGRLQRQPLPLGVLPQLGTGGRSRLGTLLDVDRQCGRMHFASSAKYSSIMVATERLDARPARRISEKLGGVPVLTFRRLQDA